MVRRKVCPEAPDRTCSYLIDRERNAGTCHRCGRTLPYNPTPIIPKVKQR